MQQKTGNYIKYNKIDIILTYILCSYNVIIALLNIVNILFCNKFYIKADNNYIKYTRILYTQLLNVLVIPIIITKFMKLLACTILLFRFRPKISITINNLIKNLSHPNLLTFFAR